MSSRLIASIGLAFCAVTFTACMDGGASNPNASSKPTEQTVAKGIATHKFAATDAERLFPKIKVADDAPLEVKAIADAKVALQRAEHVVTKLRPLAVHPLDPADIQVGQIGTLDFAMEVMRVDSESIVGRVKIGNDSRLYALEGIDTSKLATQQKVSYSGVWHAYATDKRGLYTVVVLKPAEQDKAKERASHEADNALAKARKEYEAKKKSLDEARAAAELEAIALAKVEANKRWPIADKNADATKRAISIRDHDAGERKLIIEAKKAVAVRFAEPK